MRKLLIIAFVAMLTALIILGACYIDTSGGIASFFGGLAGGFVGTITGFFGGLGLGLMQWGSAGGMEAWITILGIGVASAAFWIIFTRAAWPRIKSIKGTPTAAPMVYQNQPSVSIPTAATQTQPAAVPKPKEETVSGAA